MGDVDCDCGDCDVGDVDCDCGDCDVGGCGCCDSDCDCSSCDISSKDCCEGFCEFCFNSFSSGNNTLLLCINYGHHPKYQNDSSEYFSCCCCCCDIDDIQRQRKEERTTPSKVKNEVKEQKLKSQGNASSSPCSKRPNHPEVSAVLPPLDPPITQKIDRSTQGHGNINMHFPLGLPV